MSSMCWHYSRWWILNEKIKGSYPFGGYIFIEYTDNKSLNNEIYNYKIRSRL